MNFKNLIKILLKITPEKSKLQHYFWFSIIFIILTVFLNIYLALGINIILAILWEIIQKKNGINNTKKERLLDILFSFLLGLILVLKSIII